MPSPSPLGDTAQTLAVPLAVEGRNCWRRVRADRVALLVDGEQYYAALKSALLRARRSILWLGWDFDSRTLLTRGRDIAAPDAIGALLDHVIRRQSGLRVNVLIWDTALVFSWDREFLTWAKLRWRRLRRLDYRLDDSHPIGACHHQKIVVIDDRLAFIGGLDVSSGRWDSRAHRLDDPLRHDEVAAAYAPFHDVMLMLSGEAAAALGEVARHRWQVATGRRLRLGPATGTDDPWPPEVAPLLHGVTVAIARTMPAWEGQPAVREVERLFLDMIAAARRFVYFENQYFASRSLARALASRLRDDAAPDLVVVSCQEPVAMLERTTMGAGRARLYDRLRRDDRHDRLRLYYPVNDGHEIKIHTKLTVVDDVLLRVGSANLNNRSMGLDTECDVLIEALGDPAVEAAIRLVRCDLLAEHLGTAPAAVEAATNARGLRDGIESLRGGVRSLVPVTPGPAEAWSDLSVMADLFDPDRSLEAALVDQTKPRAATPMRLGRVVPGLVALLLACALLALLWQVAPAEMHWLAGPVRPWVHWATRSPQGIAASLLVFVAAGLLNVPASLLLIGCGALFGLGHGMAVGVAGVLASGLATYSAGRLAGRDLVRRVAGRAVPNAVRALPRHGIFVLALLRLVPVASYTVVNLVAGAARMRLATYLAGTVLGMVPVATALALFGDRLAAVAWRGSIVDLAVLCLLMVALVIIEASLARQLARGAASGQEDGRV